MGTLGALEPDHAHQQGGVSEEAESDYFVEGDKPRRPQRVHHWARKRQDGQGFNQRRLALHRLRRRTHHPHKYQAGDDVRILRVQDRGLLTDRRS